MVWVVYAERHRRTKIRLGRQRGPKAEAQVDLARRLAEAIWHMLSTNRPFAPAGAGESLAPSSALNEMRYRSEARPIPHDPPVEAASER